MEGFRMPRKFDRPKSFLGLPEDARGTPGRLPRTDRADAATSGGLCLTCGAKASLKNEDGIYCVDCMKIHLVEKMFVSLTKLQGRGCD
jgi:hypothetical protein